MEKIPDLNLLLHLDALVRCANVSRAAERLGITQSAMSAALSRLRRVFNDPLMIREGNNTQLTDKALALQTQFGPLLEQWIDATLDRLAFDASKSRRVFTMHATDYVQFVLVPAIATTLGSAAPLAGLSLLPAKPHHGLAMLESNHVEFVAGYYPQPPDTLRMRPLFEDPVVCIVRNDHPCHADDWNLEAWSRFDHVDVAAHTRNAGQQLDRQLAKLGRQRRVSMTLSSYLATPSVIAHSDLIANIPESVARGFIGQGVEIRPMPVDVPPIRIGLYWHERYHADPGHAWLRQLITESFTPPAGGPASAARASRRQPSASAQKL